MQARRKDGGIHFRIPSLRAGVFHDRHDISKVKLFSKIYDVEGSRKLCQSHRTRCASRTQMCAMFKSSHMSCYMICMNKPVHIARFWDTNAAA